MRRALLLAAVALAALMLLPPLLAPLLGLGPDPTTLPARGRAVPIAGNLELNVLELGSGPALVLVHGLPSNIGDWGELPARLAARGHRVVVYDRIGYGWSSRVPVAGDAYTFASNARELTGLLDALDLPRATLVGWSYGGGVVQQLALQAPERVAGLVLLGAVGPTYAAAPGDAVDRAARSPFGLALFRWIGAIPPLARAATRASLALAFSGAGHVPPGFLERTRAQLALPGTLAAFVAESARMDVAALTPERIEAPALVVHGSDDRSVPLAVAEDLAERLPGARLLVFERGSHMLPVTHAERLADALHEWLEASL